MKVVPTSIPAVKQILLVKHGDARGFFSETFRKNVVAGQGIELDFVQDNHSLSAEPFTIRGLHFQVAPHAQAKLVRVIHGAILDVAVDLRRGSPTYGEHVAVRVGADDWNQLFIPVGFAHGFCTLEPGTEVLYKTSDYYFPEHERGIQFDDAALGIAWPVPREKARISAKDAALPPLSQFESPFVYEGGT